MYHIFATHTREFLSRIQADLHQTHNLYRKRVISNIILSLHTYPIGGLLDYKIFSKPVYRVPFPGVLSQMVVGREGTHVLVRKLLLLQPCYLYHRTKLLTHTGERLFRELIAVEIHVQKCSIGLESHDKAHVAANFRKGLKLKLNSVCTELIHPREEDSAKFCGDISREWRWLSRRNTHLSPSTTASVLRRSPIGVAYLVTPWWTCLFRPANRGVLLFHLE